MSIPYTDRVLHAGGDSYIMEQKDPEEIVHAMRDVLGGHIYLSEEVLARPSQRSSKRASRPEIRLLDQLNDLELDILELLGRGKNNHEIVSELHCDVRGSIRIVRRRGKNCGWRAAMLSFDTLRFGWKGVLDKQLGPRCNGRPVA